MPDESSAADEHALMQEITAPLFSMPKDPVKVAADADFPVVLRGYDRVAVEEYVRRTSQLVAELQATRSPEAAVRRALEQVGEQTSGILQRAHETSAQITSQSRREAEDRLEVARAEAQQLTAAAQETVGELDAETDRIWAERQRIVEDARQLAQELLALAESAVQRFPAAESTAEREAIAAAERASRVDEETSQETVGLDPEATAAFAPVPTEATTAFEPVSEEATAAFDPFSDEDPTVPKAAPKRTEGHEGHAAGPDEDPGTPPVGPAAPPREP
ncbi:MAG: DivIVA domain-containing protein [Actinomycetota bacterium]|nr:DivIVA domain-containing protein [Actinomycetota bacterium]